MSTREKITRSLQQEKNQTITWNVQYLHDTALLEHFSRRNSDTIFLSARFTLSTHQQHQTNISNSAENKKTDLFPNLTSGQLLHISAANLIQWLSLLKGCPRGVMVKALDCRIVIREFVLQSRYYVHFRANTLGKGMSPLILLAMG